MENILYLPYSMYMEMENILFFFSLENELEIIFFIWTGKKNENSGKYILNISLLKKSGFYAIAWLVDISDWILYHLISIVIVLWLFWMTNKLCYVLTDKLCWCLTR